MSVNEIGLIMSTLVDFLAAVHGHAYIFLRDCDSLGSSVKFSREFFSGHLF